MSGSRKTLTATGQGITVLVSAYERIERSGFIGRRRPVKAHKRPVSPALVVGVASDSASLGITARSAKEPPPPYVYLRQTGYRSFSLPEG